MKKTQVSYFIIDWGTTNFRAFAMAADNTLIDTRSLPLGLLQVNNNAFAQTLEGILQDWMPYEYKDSPIYMAGMVGSAKGWKNVPYIETPATVAAIAAGHYAFDLPWGARGYIFPGVSHLFEEVNHDVMRGEETQIVGLADLKSLTEFDAILPGTHSKHVSFKNNKITQFTSYLTGEFFSLLSKHSLLGKGLPETESFSQETFIRGVKDAQQGGLSNRVFLTWTNRLFGNLEDKHAKDYLSGMLIGYELREVSAKFVYIVGGAELSSNYLLACSTLGIGAEKVEGNLCFLAGTISLIKGLK